MTEGDQNAAADKEAKTAKQFFRSSRHSKVE
jgi:hypothetical protein